MATIITHGISAVLIGKSLNKEKKSLRFWFWMIILSMLPDADVIGFRFGVQYEDFWGHRGFTHSFLFALIIGVIAMLIYCRNKKVTAKTRFFWIFFFFMITASHGIFDAMTDGGLGIAFFSPFDLTRYFFPITPIMVSPIGVSGFLSKRSAYLLWSEALWIILPLGSIYLLTILKNIVYKKNI